MGQALQVAEVDINGVVDVLVSLAQAKHIDIREKAFAGLVKIVAEAAGDPAPYAMRVLDAALAPPTNAARLSLMRPLIKMLIEAQQSYRNSGDAARTALKLFDLEWTNIRTGQRYAESCANEDDVAAAACSEYADLGAHLLDVGLAPRSGSAG